MIKKYVVRLKDEQQQTLQSVFKTPSGSSQKVRRAQTLLKADSDWPCWSESRIAEAFDCRRQTVENLHKRSMTAGFHTALNGKKRTTPPREKILGGAQEAKVIAMRLVVTTGSRGRSPIRQ